ncbi:hypothetical protein QP938_12890 [Porticoccaceae bacterium LTM1]|nr:hypothetical protein QP938_12890 [Porticoccaceae bacterium LTM1]
MKKTIFVFLFLLSMFNPSYGDDFPGIKKLMTEQQFQSSGLHKLTPTEIDSLNQWLIQYTAHDAKTIRQTTKEVREAESALIESEIDGVFYGWSGKTTFKLKNGQLWEQRDKGSWETEINSPKVEIKKNIFGFYKLHIVGTNRYIGVKRVK